MNWKDIKFRLFGETRILKWIFASAVISLAAIYVVVIHFIIKYW